MNWFFDSHPPVTGFKTGQKITKVVYVKKSPFQTIRILDTQSFGRILTLDDALQLTERDEFIYHEMLVHPLLFSHPNPQRILVIGGGDGGALREILRHRVSEVFLVDIDEEVIKAAKKYLKKVHCGAFSDKRVRVIIEDGYKFLADRNFTNFFDVIIVDSTDPLPENTAYPLFQKKFLERAYLALKSEGILSYQAGSLFITHSGYMNIYNKIDTIFPNAGIYWTVIPAFSGSMWGFVYGSKGADPKKVAIQRKFMLKYSFMKNELRYYNLGLHVHSFFLPEFIMNKGIRR